MSKSVCVLTLSMPSSQVLPRTRARGSRQGSSVRVACTSARICCSNSVYDMPRSRTLPGSGRTCEESTGRFPRASASICRSRSMKAISSRLRWSNVACLFGWSLLDCPAFSELSVSPTVVFNYWATLEKTESFGGSPASSASKFTLRLLKARRAKIADRDVDSTLLQGVRQ